MNCRAEEQGEPALDLSEKTPALPGVFLSGSLFRHEFFEGERPLLADSCLMRRAQSSQKRTRIMRLRVAVLSMLPVKPAKTYFAYFLRNI